MKKADFILIAVVGVVVAILLIFLYGINGSSGAYAQIEVNGEIVESLPLDTDTSYEIVNNDDKNILVIKDGKAKMTDANCPDGICKNHKSISRTGESIICLPHKVVITVVDDKAQDDIDVVA